MPMVSVPPGLGAPVAGAVVAAGRAPAPAKTIATVASVDYRAELVARKTGTGAAPTASVTAVTYRRNGTGWTRTGSRPLAGTFFWNTVAGPHALCRLDLATAGGAAARPHLVVQLLQSPSLGCAKAQTVSLQEG
jgi:hypothetical protein